MLLGIISDTHDHLDNIEKMKAILHNEGVEMVIHLGDYCAGPSIRAMKGLKIIGISGNNDGDLPRIMGNLKNIGGEFRGEFCVLEFDNLRCACYHGTVPEIVSALIDSKNFDVVLYGHTHESRSETKNSVIVINPGSVHGFGGKATFALFDTTTKAVKIVDIKQ